MTRLRQVKRSFRALNLAGQCSLAVWASLSVFALHAWGQFVPTLPQGGKFIAGSGAIGASSNGRLDVIQNSSRGVIDWSSFSISRGGRVFINNGTGATLSRVTGGSLSQIDGLLKATGSFYLINPNGMVIGSNGRVLTGGGFLGSSRDIGTGEFMAGGALTASGTSAGDVTNQGTILAREGDVILIGRSVDNSGSINAPNGTATLTIGNKVLLTTLNGPAGVYVAPDTSTSGTLTQSGEIRAAAAALKSAAGDIYTLAGNRTGLISATGTKTINGEVWLSAPNGRVTVAGDISAVNADGTGGQVIANGKNIAVSSGARISAQGISGGTVLLGVSARGGTDLARSTAIADGVSVLAGGRLGGGFVETSGHNVSIGSARISAGLGGSWQVDPVDLTIDTSAASTIISSLNSGTNVSEATTATTATGAGTQSAGNGDINVVAPISWSGSGALSLSAYHDLNINAPISGAGGFSGTAGGAVGLNASVSASNVLMNAGGDLTLASGAIVSGANGVTLQTAGRFINNSGSTALSGGAGNWLVYSTNPSADTTGGLAPNFIQYAATAGSTPSASGNGLLYSIAPSLSVAVSGSVEKTYDGTNAAVFNSSNAAVTGLINGDSAAVTGTYASKNAASGIAVTASNIAVTHGSIPVYGYAGTTPSASANIGQIDPAALTASIVGNPTKTYNGTTTATLGSANYQLNGFVSGEGATVNQPSSVAYDSADAGSRTISATFSSTNFAAVGSTNLSNYTLPAGATGTGTINPAPLLISGVLATDKTYDRTTSDTLNTVAAALYGVIGSDSVNLLTGGATGRFSTANAGNGLSVTASGFTLSGSKASDYALVQPTGLTASINPASLAINGVSAVDKVYDATNTAILNTSGAALSGVISGDTLTLQTASATGAFATSDAGSGIAVSASNFTLSGTAASNYRLAQPTGLTANITPRPLSAAITSTPTKTYNGDAGAVADSSDFNLTGFAGGQSATVGQTSHLSYSTPNAGTQSVTATLAVSDYTAGSGTKLSNYILPTSATGTGVINPAPITMSIVGDPTKTYDANTSASLTSSNYLLSGFISGQSVTANQSAGTYDSANAGVRQVTATLSGADFTPGPGTLLSNYAFPATVTGAGTIIPAPIQGSINAAITGNPTKSYDGNTTAFLTSSNFLLTGFAGNDNAIVTQSVGTYASKNVGVQPVTANLTPSDFNPSSGTDLSNYTLPTVAYGSGTINPASLVASIVGTPAKVYNGTTRAALTNSNLNISGLAPGEGLTISDAVQAAYAAPQAGSQTVTANIAVTDITPQSGTLLSNYLLPTSATGSGLITQAPLSILAVAAQNKTYDTTTAATLSTSGAHLFGVVGSDNVTLSTAGTAGVFATANAGSSIPVTASGFSIGGTDSANYQLVQPTGLTATIYRAPLSISGVSAANKYYDNTTTATLNAGSASVAGVLSPDSGQVSLDGSGATASFSSVNVGNNLPVSAGGFSLSGAQASNYSLAQPSGLAANINPAPLTALIIGNPTKVYDGSTSTTLTASNYQLVGFVSGQGASLPQSAAAQYLSPNAGGQGIGSTLVSSDFVANAGTNLSNYVLPVSGSGTGTITQAPLTAAIIGVPAKTYNGTTAAALTSSNYTLSGFIPGQSATVGQTTGVYDTADAGSRSVTAALSAADFTPGGATLLSNYSLPISASGPGAIDKAPLQVVNVLGTSRSYNGEVSDALNVSNAGVSGLFGSDRVTLNTGLVTGTFASKDVATGIAVTAAGFSISGGQSADYTLAQPTGLSADITQALLNLTNVTRVYDSTTGLPSSSAVYTLSGLFGSDSASVNTAGLTGSYADKNVGTGKSVSLSGLSLSGAQATDYTIASSLTNAPIGTITKAPLTVIGVAAQNKVYDATNAATLDNSSDALSGLFTNDAVTLSTTGSTGVFANKNVGNGKQVTATGYTVSGTDAGNYSFTQPTDISADITPYSGISLASVTKTYSGDVSLPNTSAAYGLSGVLGSDNVQVSTGSLSGSYATANVGSNLSVSLSGLALTGADAVNYSIGSSLSNVNIGIINPKLLTASIIGTPTKIYDTTTAAILSSSNYSLSGFITGENATVTKTSGNYSSANAGTPTVSTSLAAGDFSPIGGTLLTNYTLPTAASGAGKINQAPLTITGVAATNKTYDGSKTDTLNNTSAALSGVFAADAGHVTLGTASGIGTFASPNVGTGIAVTATGFTITGSQSANYALMQPANLSANIAQAALNLASVSKVYDAGVSAVGANVSYTLSGIVGADSVSLNTSGLTGSYAAKNVGTALDVNMVGLSLTGTQAGNYSIASSVTNAPIGTITKAPLSISGASAVNKVYDGTTTASIDNTSAALRGILGSDAVSIFSSPSTGAFSSANAGTQTVTAGSAYSVSGTDAGNYNLTQPTGFSATISQAPLTAAIINNPSKTYNATTAASLNSSDYSLSGFIGTQSATITQIAGAYDSSNAGSRNVTTSLSAGNFTQGSGTLLSNYILPTTASGAGTISPKGLTAAITGNPAKTYDGGTAATLGSGNYTLSGFIGSQGAAVTQAVGAYNDADAGSRTVTASLAVGDFTPTGGANLSNYILPTTASGAGTINQKALTAAITGNPIKTYDGSAAAILGSSDYTLGGFIGADGATITQTVGTYGSANAGSTNVTAALSTGNFTPTGGANLSNYVLPTSAAGNGAIDQKVLTAAITGNPTKTYDGATTAALVSGNYSLTGFVGSQGAAVTQAVGAYDTSDAGSRTITAALPASDFTPTGGTNLLNYILPTTASGAGTIDQKTLTASIVGNPNKPYDGGTAAALSSGNYSLNGFVGGQGAAVTQPLGAYDNSDAGSRTVTAALSSGDFAQNNGTNLNNYVLPTTASGTGTINQAILAAVITGNPTKTYDGATAVTLGSSDYILTGFAVGQGATVNQTSGTYDDADAGSRTVTAALSSGNFAQNNGTNLNNYVLPTTASGTGTINQAILAAVITGNPTKTYDGATAAALGSGNYALSGFVAGQGAAVTQTAGSYDDADAGSRTVTATLGSGNFAQNSGTNLNNYVLPTTASGTGTINQATLAAAITGNPTKTYDGATAANLGSSDYTLTGFAVGQGAAVTQTVATYDDADAGSRTVAAALSPGNFAQNSGTNLNNYILPTTASGAGTIDPKMLTAAIIGDPSKTYDGATAATLGSGNYTLSGFVAGQGAAVTQTAGSYDIADAGSRIVTAVLGSGNFAQNNGTNLNNYVLPTTALGAGTINQATLAAALTGNPMKAYDGSTTATLGSGNYTLTGFVAGQGAAVTQTAGSYDDADAGSRTVTATLSSGNFVQNNGTNLNNYVLPTTASGAGTIDPKTLTAAISGNPSKTYDGATAATLGSDNYTFTGFAAGQGATVNQTSGTYDVADAGSRTVTATLSSGNFSQNIGTNLNNYVLPTTASGAGTINQKMLTGGITGSPVKTYDGTAIASLDSDNYSLNGFIAGQRATVTQTIGLYDSASAGARTVSATLRSGDFTAAAGTNLGNYLLPSFVAGTGSIAQRALTAVIVGSPTKMADGTLLATLSPADYALMGFISGQGAAISQTVGTYDSSVVGFRGITANLGLQNFNPNSGTLLTNYVMPVSAVGTGIITPAILTNAPTLTQAIASNMTIRNLAPDTQIAQAAAQAVFGAAMPRTYIPYPAPSTLSTWQNNGFGSLPTIVYTDTAPRALSGDGDRLAGGGSSIINSTEQILLQGGKNKSWHILPPPTISTNIFGASNQ